MNNVEIVSTGSYLPGEALTNSDLERLVGGLSPEILEQVQVEKRYWLIDPVTGEHCMTNSEMATNAARQALELANMAPEEVEFLVASTSSPDFPLPSLVTLVQDQLGLKRCAILEIRGGCAGAAGSAGRLRSASSALIRSCCCMTIFLSCSTSARRSSDCA